MRSQSRDYANQRVDIIFHLMIFAWLVNAPPFPPFPPFSLKVSSLSSLCFKSPLFLLFTTFTEKLLIFHIKSSNNFVKHELNDVLTCKDRKMDALLVSPLLGRARKSSAEL